MLKRTNKRRKSGAEGDLGRLVRISSEESPDEDKVGQQQFAKVTQLSTEQEAARDYIVRWLAEARSGAAGFRQVTTLGGYAGTGKTTLLGVLAGELCRELQVAFCTLTGKAASVLERSLRANGVEPAYVGTIHRMMYQPVVDELSGEVADWEKAGDLPYDLVVVDEASMLSSALFDDMRQYGVPILAVGDHGQLPPVGEDVGLMQHPDVKLETVRRQALDNPIVYLSQLIRQGGDWRGYVKTSTDPRVAYVDRFDVMTQVMDRFAGFQDRPFSEDPLVLCGTNRTRSQLNKTVRAGLRTKNLLIEGERVICLKNSYLTGLLLPNGVRGKVKRLGRTTVTSQSAHVVFPDEGLELRDGQLCKAQFGAERTFRTFTEVSPSYRSWNDVGLLFDWGYACTVHKAQGSQSDDAIVYVEQMGTAEDFQRWAYTAVTRATKRLTMSF